MVGRSE